MYCWFWNDYVGFSTYILLVLKWLCWFFYMYCWFWNDYVGFEMTMLVFLHALLVFLHVLLVLIYSVGFGLNCTGGVLDSEVLKVNVASDRHQPVFSSVLTVYEEEADPTRWASASRQILLVWRELAPSLLRALNQGSLEVPKGVPKTTATQTFGYADAILSTLFGSRPTDREEVCRLWKITQVNGEVVSRYAIFINKE